MVPTVCSLLGIDANRLNIALINRTSVTRGEVFVTPLSQAQAIDSRDALAKAIYGRMFSWIVTHINSTTQTGGSLPFVGILDIFGFEDFQVDFPSTC